jgi:hypothetical protein
MKKNLTFWCLSNNECKKIIIIIWENVNLGRHVSKDLCGVLRVLQSMQRSGRKTSTQRQLLPAFVNCEPLIVTVSPHPVTMATRVSSVGRVATVWYVF